jgi:uncharacterized protein YqeY
MTIKILEQDMIQAMKTGDIIRRDVLRSVIAAIKKTVIDKQVEITENLIDEVLTKEKKIIKEQLDTCPSDRVDLIKEYTNKLAIISEYAPKLLDNPEETKATIIALIATTGLQTTKSNRGAIMKLIMPQIKGKVDMKIANEIINKILI